AIPGVTLSVQGSSDPVTSQASSYKSTGNQVFSLNGNTNWNSSSEWLRADFINPVETVSIDIIGDDSDDPGILQTYDANGTLLEEIISPSDTNNKPYTLAITRASRDIAYILASGLNGDTVYLDNLVTSGDDTDYYSIQVDSGDVLEIRTTTPDNNIGEVTNTLDPLLEIYNENDVLVSSDDNSDPDGRNAWITYTVPNNSNGTYTISLSGKNRGTYSLSVIGANPTSDPAPFVTSTTPVNQTLSTLPTTIDITLSEAVRVDSVNSTDLVVSGDAVITAVEMVDGSTASFQVTVPDVDGTYTYTSPAGAFFDLQGRSSAEYQASFTIDRTGPRVIAQTPATEANAPLSELSFSFSEDINSSTFTTDDIVSFTSPDGTNLLNQITDISGFGTNFEVAFNPQIAPGIYNMVIGPNIEDIVGNQMDQDENRTSGETSDVFIASLNLLTPDLLINQVDVSSTNVVLSEIIDVSWITNNVGTADVTRNCNNRIWLSRDTAKSNDDMKAV
ncbi:MAG: Ig-like domain-containing protein, partial [Rivularia sp. (in: cyanobacteria)]